MSLTIRQLRSWTPAALDSAAADIHRTHQQVGDARVDLDRAVRMLDRGWEGDASTAAAASIRAQAQAAEALGATLSLVRRVTLAFADALTEAKTLLAQAEELATAHGLQVHEPGQVVYGPSVTTEDQDPETARRVNALIRHALQMAQDADADAARALRAALDAGELGVLEQTALVDDIAAPDTIPAGPPDAVAAWWALLTAGEQAALLRLHPDVIGNLEGVPYDVRIEANRRHVLDTLLETRGEIPDLEKLVADLQAQVVAAGQAISAGSRGYPDPGLMMALNDAEARLAAARDMERFCTDLLTGHTTGFDAAGNVVDVSGHQVLIFDPDNGRFAEIVGSLGLNTQNVAVMVGGTGSNFTGMGGDFTRANQFVTDPQVHPPGSLTIITYLGGPMPQEVAFDAFDNSYAKNLGPGLADFVNHLQNPTDAPVTVVGHSYGGSVVGAAEVAGMHADRVLHVESAGAGPGVDSINDYAYPDTDRYSMTAPGDPIEYAQGTNAGPVGHGADPNELGNAVRLETGYADARHPSEGILQGSGAHSGVFNPGSTAYNNILGVLTGDDVSLYRPPDWVRVEVNGQIVDDWQYPMENPDYHPPTMDVP